MKKLALAALLFVAVNAAAANTRTIATANAASCDIGTYAAATLLLPYFEVEYEQPQNEALNTVFTVINTSDAPQIVRVTIWTDWGYPATWFSMFLTGYDAHSVSMYDILARGNRPFTTSMQPIGSSSSDKNPHFNDEIWCDFAGGSLGPEKTARLQRILTTGVRDDADCPVGGVHPYAVGYVTLDVVNSCALDSPMDDSYWKEVILYDNVLTGDYERINPKSTTGNYAGGNPLVHIRAIPEGGAVGNVPTPLPYTFYDRYTPADARHIDRRQPLPAVFAARFINGGKDSFQTNFAVWREGVVGRDMDECSYKKNSRMPLFAPMVVRFDEHENSVVSTGCDENGCSYPTTGLSTLISAASPLLPPAASGDVAGWVWFNLDNGAGTGKAGSPYSTPRPSQNWIIIQMYAEGRYAVDFDATTITNGCTLKPPTQP